jgi:myo-inositol-1(or 4)-monophosphatase
MDDNLKDRVALGHAMVERHIVFFEESFGHVTSQWKYDGSRVTEADLALSKAFEADLSERFPEDLFLSEELDSEGGVIDIDSEFAWLVDPIDGTNNFARGIPACSISVALLKGGVPVYGFLYDQMSRKIIHGGKGYGVWVGDREVSFRNEKPDRHSIVGAQHCGLERSLKDDCALQQKFKIRNFGSSAIQLAYTVVGWTDGVIAHRVNVWDVAAGVAMMKETGGCIHYFKDDPFPLKTFDVRRPTFGYLAGRQQMKDEMLTVIGGT